MSYLPDHVVSDLLTQVACRDGNVHLLFSREVEGEMRPAETNHLMLDAKAALALGECIMDIAFEADTGLKPVGPAAKAELVRKHRQRLLPRIELMLNGQREKRTVTNRALATQLIDAIFAEVFS